MADTNLTEEMIIVVDDHDQNPQQIARSLVIAERLLHRSILIYLFNSAGEFFLQKRVSSKPAYPDHWDAACAGAVTWGETYLQSAVRELEEELDIKIQPENLKPFSKPFRVTTDQTDEFDQLFYCYSDDPITLQASEVADGKWVKITDIENTLVTELVTPWFVESWKIWKSNCVTI